MRSNSSAFFPTRPVASQASFRVVGGGQGAIPVWSSFPRRGEKGRDFFFAPGMWRPNRQGCLPKRGLNADKALWTVEETAS